MAQKRIKYCMQRVDLPGQTEIDLENDPDYVGLKYMQAKGINTVGESKNVYTEQYADSDRLRAYLPPDGNYANKATVITMTFLVIGSAKRRQATIDNLYEYVRKGVHRYWDTARNREFDFIVTDEIDVSDEKWYGSQPYVEITLKMQNLNGSTRPYTAIANREFSASS